MTNQISGRIALAAGVPGGGSGGGSRFQCGYSGAGISIPSDTQCAVAFPDADFNDLGLTTSGNITYHFPVAGLYLITVYVTATAVKTGVDFFMWLSVSNTDALDVIYEVAGTVTGALDPSMILTGVHKMCAGCSIHVGIQQNSGSASQVNYGVLSIVKIG